MDRYQLCNVFKSQIVPEIQWSGVGFLISSFGLNCVREGGREREREMVLELNSDSYINTYTHTHTHTHTSTGPKHTARNTTGYRLRFRV
jgi:hypothetical protein